MLGCTGPCLLPLWLAGTQPPVKFPLRHTARKIAPLCPSASALLSARLPFLPGPNGAYPCNSPPSRSYLLEPVWPLSSSPTSDSTYRPPPLHTALPVNPEGPSRYTITVPVLPTVINLDSVRLQQGSPPPIHPERDSLVVRPRVASPDSLIHALSRRIQQALLTIHRRDVSLIDCTAWPQSDPIPQPMRRWTPVAAYLQLVYHSLHHQQRLPTSYPHNNPPEPHLAYFSGSLKPLRILRATL